MAKIEKWVQQWSYPNRKKTTFKMHKTNPEKYGLKEEDFDVRTVPGQSKTVKEIMQRYEKGRPQPQE